MSSIEHKKAKEKLKSIATVTEFNDFIDLYTLSEMDKEILRRRYINNESYQRIGEALDYSVDTIKLKHSKILKKIK